MRKDCFLTFGLGFDARIGIVVRLRNRQTVDETGIDTETVGSFNLIGRNCSFQVIDLFFD